MYPIKLYPSFFFPTEAEAQYQWNKAILHNTKLIFWSSSPLSSLPSSLAKKKKKNIKSTSYHLVISWCNFSCISSSYAVHVFKGFFSLHSLNLIKTSFSFCFQIISAALAPPGNVISLTFSLKGHFPKIQRFFLVTIFGLVFHPKISVTERASVCAQK